MAYTTEFTGDLQLSRALTLDEISQVQDYLDTHKDGRLTGWKLDGFSTTDVLNCPETSNGEKEAVWLQEMIEKFFKPWGITVNGYLDATGSDASGEDMWYLEVTDNDVTTGEMGRTPKDRFEELDNMIGYIKLHYPQVYNEAMAKFGYTDEDSVEDEAEEIG